MSVGQKVKKAREAAGLSQKGLAVKIGVSECTIIRLEKGRRQPRTGELEQIAATLHVPLSELIDSAFTSDLSPVSAPQGAKIEVPLLSPEIVACCGAGVPTYSEIQNAPEKLYRYTIEELGGVYDAMRPPIAVYADGACLERSHIYDGDVLVINPALEPRHLQICVVCWRGVLSAKRVSLNADGSVDLRSDFDVYHIDAKEAANPERFQLWGPVVESKRRFI